MPCPDDWMGLDCSHAGLGWATPPLEGGCLPDKAKPANLQRNLVMYLMSCYIQCILSSIRDCGSNLYVGMRVVEMF